MTQSKSLVSRMESTKSSEKHQGIFPDLSTTSKSASGSVLKQKQDDNADNFITSSPRKRKKGLQTEEDAANHSVQRCSSKGVHKSGSTKSPLFSPLFSTLSKSSARDSNPELDPEQDLEARIEAQREAAAEAAGTSKTGRRETKRSGKVTEVEEEDPEAGRRSRSACVQGPHTPESSSHPEEVEEDEEEEGEGEGEEQAPQCSDNSEMCPSSDAENVPPECRQLSSHIEEEEEEDEEDDEEFDLYLFIKNLPPLESCVEHPRAVLLPPKTRQAPRVTLVLDLDETLVHSSLEGVTAGDFVFPVLFNDVKHTVSVRTRPGLEKFMQAVSSKFEVIVFTASQRVYAEQLLNILDPGRRYIRHRIFRDSCVLVNGNYLKDLSVLGRDLRHVVIVDNSPQAFGFQVDNGIPIESWFDDDEDQQLLDLLGFLETLVDADDVRPHIAKQFALRERIELTCSSLQTV